MFARDLEEILHLLTAEGDFRPYTPRDMEDRFKSLRSYRKLPQGRERRSEHLSSAEIAATVLGLVPANPAWAGHAAMLLEGLQPVGGTWASFKGAKTLGSAIQRLLERDAVADGLIDVTLSAAAFGTNSNGFATLRWQSASATQTTHFVSRMAVSLMRPGAEETFKPEELRSEFTRIVVLSARLFSDLRRRIESSMVRLGEPAGNGSEYDAEEAREARAVRLGVRPGSRFLNIGVDTQATWPKKETVVAFDRYRSVLLPQTNENAQSVHIDLQEHGLSNEEGMTLINRFLSMVAWCDDQFAVAGSGVSGNPIPVPVPKSELGASTALHWSFQRHIPEGDKARRALGHYREARNALHGGLVSYAVLSYYKVIECGLDDDTRKVRAWIKREYPIVASIHAADPSFVRFREVHGTEFAEEHLNKACRVAVAHASSKVPSDVDDIVETRRLHTAAEILRALSRRMIEHDLEVSTRPWEHSASP